MEPEIQTHTNRTLQSFLIKLIYNHPAHHPLILYLEFGYKKIFPVKWGRFPLNPPFL